MTTLQTIFDRGVSAVLKQGRVAYDYGVDQCAYRAPDGSKCLIGHLIDDEHYSDSLEGLGANDPPVIEALSGSLGVDVHHLAPILRRLQECHDNGALGSFIPSFRMHCREFARTYDLNTKVLDNPIP